MPPWRNIPERAIAGLLALTATLAAQEVQRHGLVFEGWIDDTFFAGYRPRATPRNGKFPPPKTQAAAACP